MQQHLMQGHQMQSMIMAFATNNITAEHIQKYQGLCCILSGSGGLLGIKIVTTSWHLPSVLDACGSEATQPTTRCHMAIINLCAWCIQILCEGPCTSTLASIESSIIEENLDGGGTCTIAIGLQFENMGQHLMHPLEVHLSISNDFPDMQVLSRSIQESI
eukprot:Gb_21030 [translate_table: standard]